MSMSISPGIGMTESIGLAGYERNLGVLNSARSDFSQSAHESKTDLQTVAQSFEAMLFGIMIKSMKETVHQSALLGKGLGEDLYVDMLYTEYATQGVGRFNTGIAEALYRQIGTTATNEHVDMKVEDIPAPIKEESHVV